MRTIKFRVWDNKISAYVIPAHTMNVHTGQISDIPERFILEQFTGLHDKNGKEIFEGDIVNAQMRTGWDDKANPIHGEMNKTYVEWQSPELQFGFLEYEYEKGEQGYIPFEKVNIKTLEVIGNIHE